jgi:hypothetical protein
VAVQLKRKPLPCDTNSKGSYRYPNGYAPVIPLVVLEPILHKLYGSEDFGEYFIGRTVTDVQLVSTSLTVILLL